MKTTTYLFSVGRCDVRNTIQPVSGSCFHSLEEKAQRNMNRMTKSEELRSIPKEDRLREKEKISVSSSGYLPF